MLCLVAGLTLSASPLAAQRRQLSQAPVGKYSPSTDVRDHANIDLDQMTLENAFGTSPYDFTAVKSAWEGAGFSKVTATCTLSAAALTSVANGAKIDYTGVDNNQYEGTATAAVTSGSTTVVTFKTAVALDNRNSRVQTGTNLVDDTSGNTIGTCSQATYVGGRTLQGFSTAAKSKMYLNVDDTPIAGSCPAPKSPAVQYQNGCPYTSFVPYFNYYCASATSACFANGDYVNQFVIAGTDALQTSVDNFNIDFQAGTTGNEETLRKDFVKKTSKFAGAWMYAIREFEDAIDDCSLEDLTSNAWSDASVHAWDEGVAFYVGSQISASDFYDPITGEEKVPPNKYLAYTLGNKRCTNFKTCGRGGDAAQGEAYINFELWKLFGDGRDQILAGNCAGAVPVKNRVVELMSVPLIQGTLRYSYFCSNGKTCTAKAVGELAAFAFSILPQVHACDASAAATIATAANPATYTCATDSSCTTTSGNDFAAVKAAFESCYSSMGITCAEVGGLYDANSLEYETGAELCSDLPPSSPGANNTITETVKEEVLDTWAIVGIAVGASLAVIFCLGLVYVYKMEKAGKPVFVPMVGGSKTAV